MRIIKAEMLANQGVYPANGGVLSKNEVARRAGIGLTTWFSPKQRRLGQAITRWTRLISKAPSIAPESKTKRRTRTERADAWKAKFEALQDSNLKCELDLQQALAEKDELVEKLHKLQIDFNELQSKLTVEAGSNVIPFPLV